MEEEVFAKIYVERRHEGTSEERPLDLESYGSRERTQSPPNWMEMMRIIKERMTKDQEE